jgi:hypothetical protein
MRRIRSNGRAFNQWAGLSSVRTQRKRPEEQSQPILHNDNIVSRNERRELQNPFPAPSQKLLDTHRIPSQSFLRNMQTAISIKASHPIRNPHFWQGPGFFNGLNRQIVGFLASISRSFRRDHPQPFPRKNLFIRNYFVFSCFIEKKF